MCLSYVVVISSVFMMALCSTVVGGPQAVKPVSGLPDDDAEFIKLLVSEDCGGQAKCTPFHKCCDKSNNQNNGQNNGQNYEFDVYRTAHRTIDIDDHKKNSPCNDILSICCETTCKEDPTTTTTASPGDRHDPSAQCGTRSTILVRSFIITGIGFNENQAQYGEFPWMVAVLDKDNNFIGGGSLVHHRIILTAAHKVHKKNSSNLIARAGDWDITSTSEPIQFQQLIVEKIVVHPDFQERTLENNVALLILKKDAVYTDTVMPICLPQPGQDFRGANCFVTGWGKDVFGNDGKYQAIMKKKALLVVNNNDCETMLQRTRLGPNFRLKSSFNCAGNGTENACTGDGGSPLICPDPNNPSIFVQVGIVSWGIGCGEAGSPTVFASVPKTVSWINEMIEIEGGFSVNELAFRTLSKQ